jgi:mannose-6-phosphate isomerase-like protein (cupin superfamily)
MESVSIPTGIPLATSADYTRAMRRSLATILLLAGSVGYAQTPPSAPGRSGMAITVTDPQGATLPGVRVQVLGASDRSGATNASGQMSFTGMQAGTYRVRLDGERVVSFEREIVLRAGQTATVDITLNAAPPPPEPVEPPPPPVGPAGEPRMLSILDLVEKELVASDQPSRYTLVSCSGNTRSTLIQLNQDQPQRLYDTADMTYYVIAGAGAVRMGVSDTALSAGGFVSIPRGTPHALLLRGRRPLIVLATLSGAPCEEPR